MPAQDSKPLHIRMHAADNVVIARIDLPQGSTALSSGFIPAAGTAVQTTHGPVGAGDSNHTALLQQ